MEDSELSDQAIEWFACIRSDTVTEEKLRSFVEWLRLGADHQKEFMEIARLWDGLAIIRDMDFPELKEFPLLWDINSNAKAGTKEAAG